MIVPTPSCCRARFEASITSPAIEASDGEALTVAGADREGGAGAEDHAPDEELQPHANSAMQTDTHRFTLHPPFHFAHGFRPQSSAQHP